MKKNAEIMTVDMPTSSGSTGTNEHSDLSTDVAGQKRKRRTRADIKVTNVQAINKLLLCFLLFLLHVAIGRVPAQP